MKPIYLFGTCGACDCMLDNICRLRFIANDGEERHGVIQAVVFMGMTEQDFLFEVRCLSCGVREVVHYERTMPMERSGTVSAGAVMVGLGILPAVKELNRILATNITLPLLYAVASS